MRHVANGCGASSPPRSSRSRAATRRGWPGRRVVAWHGQGGGHEPASLYTYVDGIDDLFTRVLLDSFHDLATHVEAAADRHADDQAAARLLACCRRTVLGVDHPQASNLTFTDQIPGYAVPPHGNPDRRRRDPGLPADGERASATIVGRSRPARAGRPAARQRTRPSPPFAARHGFVMLETATTCRAGNGDETLSTTSAPSEDLAAGTPHAPERVRRSGPMERRVPKPTDSAQILSFRAPE